MDAETVALALGAISLAASALVAWSNSQRAGWKLVQAELVELKRVNRRLSLELSELRVGVAVLIAQLETHGRIPAWRPPPSESEGGR